MVHRNWKITCYAGSCLLKKERKQTPLVLPANCVCLLSFFLRLSRISRSHQTATVSRTISAPSSLFRASSASRDNRPGPAMSRKIVVINCAYSERISCSTAQNPICGGEGGRGKGDVPK